ncbi:hypothetical protein GIV31_08030, partial [Pseudomonas syringae]|nr:hypothetical protein [Pseudomonas syringae]
YRPFREQVRSYGLRPESKADLCITLSAVRGQKSGQQTCASQHPFKPSENPIKNLQNLY